jgi:hypothetical protein
MVTFVLSSSPEQIAVQNRGYAIISRPDIASVKDLKGKRLAINTFGARRIYGRPHAPGLFSGSNSAYRSLLISPAEISLAGDLATAVTKFNSRMELGSWKLRVSNLGCSPVTSSG